MKNLLRDMPYFVEVARQKSFTKAADILNVPISTLSRRIAALEKELGVPLFLRTTRSVELTENGISFFASCDFIIRETETSMERLRQNLHSPSGRVRIAMHTDLYYVYMRGIFSDFLEKYPEIQLSVNFTSRPVDLHTDPFDLEIRAGNLPDSSLIARRLGAIKAGLYASPHFLEKYKKPEHPTDLLSLPCIMPEFTSSLDMYLHKGDVQVYTPIKGAHISNSQGLSMELVLAGLGFSGFVDPLAAPLVKEGRLVRLLPEWDVPSFNFYVLMATYQPPQRVRLMVEHLAAHFNALAG